MDIKIGSTYFDESCVNWTFVEFKEYVSTHDLGKSILIDVQKAYDIIQGCEGCQEKKPVKKVTKKRRTVKKKP